MSEFGRACPVDYHYSPDALARAAELSAETLYVVGGLYGNPYALDAVMALCEEETEPPTVVFNGDFHWLDVDPAVFLAINERVLAHAAIRGNVETELARGTGSDGCGCGYPEWIDDTVVASSNAVMARLQRATAALSDATARLGELPMHLVAEVGGQRVVIVHGDAESLAGWGFAQEALGRIEAAKVVERWCELADTRFFACTHTGLPVAQTFDFGKDSALVVNNGAAGLPNMRLSRFGLVTRISVRAPPAEVCYGLRFRGLHVHAVPVRYDHDAWERAFLQSWPPGTPAHAVYFDRIVAGPAYEADQAARGRVVLGSASRS